MPRKSIDSQPLPNLRPTGAGLFYTCRRRRIFVGSFLAQPVFCFFDSCMRDRPTSVCEGVKVAAEAQAEAGACRGTERRRSEEVRQSLLGSRSPRRLCALGGDRRSADRLCYPAAGRGSLSALLRRSLLILPKAEDWKSAGGYPFAVPMTCSVMGMQVTRFYI